MALETVRGVLASAVTSTGRYSQTLKKVPSKVDFYITITGTASVDVEVSDDGVLFAALQTVTATGTSVVSIYKHASVIAINATSISSGNVSATFRAFITGDIVNDTPGPGSVTVTISAATPSDSVQDETTYGITPDAGASVEYSRGDHTHGSPAAPTTYTDEQAQDAVGGILANSANIALTYVDSPASISALLAIASQAQGDIIYFNGTNWVRLGAGSSGYFLQTQGASANPQWASVGAPPSGGGVPGAGTLFDPTTTFFVKDDFLAAGFSSEQTGELSWGFNTGAAQGVAPVAGHPGIVQRSTSGANQTYMWLYNAADSLLPSESFDNIWILLPDSAGAGANGTLRFGFFASLANPPTDGIYIEKLTSDTDWFGVCRSGGSENRTASLGAVSSSTWARLRIRRVNGSTIGFSINGGTELTLSSTVPTADLTVVGQVGSGSGTVLCQVDYWSLLITGLSR